MVVLQRSALRNPELSSRFWRGSRPFCPSLPIVPLPYLLVHAAWAPAGGGIGILSIDCLMPWHPLSSQRSNCRQTHGFRTCSRIIQHVQLQCGDGACVVWLESRSCVGMEQCMYGILREFTCQTLNYPLLSMCVLRLSEAYNLAKFGQIFMGMAKGTSLTLWRTPPLSEISNNVDVRILKVDKMTSFSLIYNNEECQAGLTIAVAASTLQNNSVRSSKITVSFKYQGQPCQSVSTKTMSPVAP